MNKLCENILKYAYLITFYGIISATSEVYIDTKLGRLKGVQKLSRDGKEFNAFLNIPFAQPPVGVLRFQDPLPVHPWNGTWDATVYPPYCPQIIGDFKGDEDCLYLNLYSPVIDNDAKLPVLVWIYPGRRLFGDTRPYHYGAEYFMDKPMIVITFNYRLGVIGFFSTEDDAASGNYGLKDQVAVLRWIRDYVSDFGGDPSNVTLCGESSGAVDVSLHLFSPLSKGLFHKAISQSGQPMNYRTLLPKGHNRMRAWELAKIMQCDKDIITSNQLVECLRTFSAKDLTLNMFRLMHDYVLPHSIFGPVIEHTSGAFLATHPISELNKTSNLVPWLLGVTTDEGSQKTLGIYTRPIYWNHVIDHYERIFPDLFSYEYLPNSKNITDIILRKYVGDVPLRRAFQGISKIFGFATVQLGSIESALHYRGPTYFYHFDHLHEVPYVRVYQVVLKLYCSEKTGVIHGEEIRSLFHQPYLFPPVLKGEDRLVSDKIINFWYNFAAYSNPNGRGPEFWKPVSTSNLEYLYISSHTIKMKSNLMWQEYGFWKNLSNPPLLMPHMLENSKVLEIFF